MFSTRIATQIYAKICFETTPGQKKIIEKLSEYLADDDFSRIFVLNGYAGTGKTTLIAGLVGALKDLGIKPVLLAPTGRAAKVLAQYAQEKALTIHKRIYRQRTNADYESKFSLNINPERGAVFIVDEASMLSDNTQGGAVFGSGSLLSDLVEYVRSGRGCRLVLVGDSAQLPPVGADFSPALDPVSMDAYGGIVYGTMDEVASSSRNFRIAMPDTAATRRSSSRARTSGPTATTRASAATCSMPRRRSRAATC